MIRAAIGYAALAPYLLFFLVVLCPVAVLSYALAAIARTAYANLVAGWVEHR
jgi:hypothetical protein